MQLGLSISLSTPSLFKAQPSHIGKASMEGMYYCSKPGASFAGAIERVDLDLDPAASRPRPLFFGRRE